MNRHLRALLIVGGIAVLAGLVALSALKQPDGDADVARVLNSPVQMNMVLPGFEAKTLDGKDIRLSDFKGKIVVVNFWASWCGPCIEEMPSLLTLIKTFPKDVALLAISGDSTREDIDSFLKSFPEMKSLPNIYLIWDENKTLAQKYQIYKLPESILLNGEQKVVKKISGIINWSAPDAIEYIKQLSMVVPSSGAGATAPDAKNN